MYTRGTVAPAPLPAPQPYTSAHLIAKGFERVHIGLSAALEPRPTHHLLKSSSPSARSSIRRHCVARFPPDPATLNLSRERFPFSCGRCEQNKLFHGVTLPPAYRASHPASMVLSRLLIATPYNDSITVRRPAPRDHPSHFPDTACPKRPKPAPLSPADV